MSLTYFVFARALTNPAELVRDLLVDCSECDVLQFATEEKTSACLNYFAKGRDEAERIYAEMCERAKALDYPHLIQMQGPLMDTLATMEYCP